MCLWAVCFLELLSAGNPGHTFPQTTPLFFVRNLYRQTIYVSQDKHTGEPDTENPSPPEMEDEVLKKLPRFEGIGYKLIKAPDGRPCVIATGNTAAKKDLLSGSGFKLNKDRKIWWMYADAV